MTGGAFLSYSSQDRDDLGDLLSALHRADEPVWFDEDLGGGEVWWQKILERIRECEVFLFALSDNSLQSRPCLAELRYAQALGKPVLPIQIGPVESIRTTPLATVEAIDFQTPTLDSGIRLITAVQRAKKAHSALPSPLPDEPPVPFAHLMKLASAIAGEQLDAAEQAGLLAELTAVLTRDGADGTTRRDVARLLRTLHDRPDATDLTRIETERLLQRVGVATVSAGGPTVATRRRPQRWLISAVASIAVIGAVTAALLARAHPDPATSSTGAPPSSSAAVPLVPDDRVDSLLLGAPALNAIMGATDMQGDPPGDELSTYDTQISDPDCLGADYAAAQPVYAGSGWSAVSAQTLSDAAPADAGVMPFWVSQAAVSFPSEQQAGDFVNTSASLWTGCSGRVVKESASTGPLTFTYGALSRDGDTVTQLSFEEGGRGAGCQHTLAAYANVVVEAVACGPHITDEASRIVEQMLNRARS